MNNEPVAWMNKDNSSLSFKNHGGGWQPLYTHPVKETYPAKPPETHVDLVDWVKELIVKEQVK
jgi:hypothetical protein